MTQDTPTKVLSTEELLKRFNAQKAGQVEPLKKDPWGYEPVDIDVMLSAEAPKRASETLTESFKQKYPDFEERTMSIPGPYGQPAGQRTIPYSATAAKDTALNKQFQTDYKKYKAEHDRLSGLEDIGVKDSDIPKLRENAVSTRDSLRNLAKKIEDEYLREFKMPKVSYMQPGGQGTYNFESPGQSKAFYEYQDAKNKLDQAVRYLDRAINIPDTKKEAGKAAFENELHNIISAGISGMLEDINTARAAKGLAKGDKDDISKALVDAYGQLQTLTSIASANIPRYRRALSVAGSIPYMEQFALTGGIGTSAGATAKAAGQAVTKGITNKFVKGLTRRAVQYPIEGAISMIGRVPLSPATYAGIAQQGIGELKKVDGKYYIDPNAMPTIGQAIASGVYNSAKEIFSESLGGMIDLPAGLFPDAIVKAIGPGVKQFFKMVGMNNPQGEFFEEMVSQALGGENPLDPEFLKDLAVTIPIITGGFSALSVPSVAGQIKINYDKKKVVDTFGWDTVNEIYDIIQTGDANAVSAKLYELQNPKAGWKDYDNLIKYAASLVQEKTQEDMADQPASTENIQQQEDIDAVNQVRAKGREYTLGGFNDQDPGANVIRYADTRDKRKVIIISGKHIEGSGTIYTVRDANSPDAPVQMISEKDVVNTLNVPYEEWVQNELRQYHEIRNQVDSDMAKANAPVQEGQEITLENKSWIVTRVTPEGVTLNEISQEGNITGNIQQVTPDQYNNVFVAPQTDQAQEIPAEQPTEQPITETVRAEAPIPEAQQQARKISDGRNEFTVSPREDGNFQVAETFQTQKEAETTIKKLQALYPKLKWEYEMEDSGDYFTPDIYRIVAKTPRKKEVVQQPQAEATPIEQETPKIAPIETPIEAPAQTELQAQGQIENIEKQPPVVEQTAAPLTPGETVPVEAEMQEAGEVEIAEPREVEPEQKTERPANLQPISVFKPGDRIRNSAGDVWEVVEVPGDENKPAVLRDIQDGTTTDWNQKIASWTLEKKEESPEIQMMKANREVDPNPSEAQKEAGNYQKGHIKWQGMDITIETAPMTIRKGTDKSGKEWKQLMHNAYGYIRRTLGPKTEGKDQVDVFLGDNLESETVYVIDQVDPRTQLFDEPKTMIGFNSAEEASQAYLANYEPGWKGLGAITPMPVSEFKEWVFDRTKTSRPVDPSVKVSGDSPQTTSESKDTKKEDTSQNVKSGNLEFAGEFLEKPPEPGPSVNLKIEPPAEPATTKPIDKESLPKHEDFGEKIGGARKDMGITRTVRDTDALPAWRRKYFYADPSGVMNLGDPTIDTSKPFLVKWSKEVKSWSGTRTMGYPVTTIDTRETKIFNSEAEAEAYIPIYEVWKQGFRIRKKDGNYVITKTSSTGKVVEYATFPTEEEANTYMYSTEGATSLLNHKREDFSIPALDKVERTGKDWRKGKDISTEEFMETFGFRGGEFGNWVKPEERRVMLNAAYDSFMDLAELLGVPPRSLSLSGELSIAFGARGVKGAAAHFEPDRAVINLTRMNGAGSLAHEWAHALDNYFGLQAAKKDYSRNDKGEVIAGKVMRTTADLLSVRGMRKELSEIFDKLIEATQEKSVTRKMGIEEKQKYFDKFQKSVQREADNLIKKFTNGVRRYQYNRKTKQREDVVIKATPDQIKKAKNIVDKIITGEGTKPTWERIPGSKGMGKYSYISPETLALEELHKAVFGKTGLDRDGNGFYNLGYYGDRMYRAKETLDKALAGESETLNVPTDFLKVSREFDKSRATPYWSTRIEMFARAFEYFIESKLLDQNVRADYLQYDKAPVYDAVYGKNPYPQGEERAELNRLFEKFFKEVRVKTDENNVSLLYEKAEEYISENKVYLQARPLQDFPEGVSYLSERSGGSLSGQLNLFGESDYTPTADDGNVTYVERLISERGVTFLGDKLTGPPTIRTSADIAFLFKNLESATSENAFAVLISETGEYKVLYLGTGGTTGVIIDSKLIIAAAKEFGAKRVVVVHNHPSGNLKPSGADMAFDRNIMTALESMDIDLDPSIIIDLDSGEFTVFAGENVDYKKYRKEDYGTDVPVEDKTIYQFEKKKLYVPASERTAVKNSADIAEYLSKMKRGTTPKLHVMILDRSLHINRYLLYDETISNEELISGLLYEVGKHGEMVALASNTRMSPGLLVDLAAKLKKVDSDIIDFIQIKQGDDIINNYMSYADEGYLSESKVSYGSTESSRERQPEFAGEYLERAQDITKTPAFKKWFGDSKVVDENGRPLVVYHGTIKDFDEFDLSKVGSRLDKGLFGFGFYFTPSPNHAEMYGAGDYENGNIMPVYLSIKNPYYFDEHRNDPEHKKLWGDWGYIDKGKEESFRDWLIEKGYDGVIVEHRKQIVAFSPTQIKSATGNRGTFNPENSSILEEPQPPYQFAGQYLNDPTILQRGAERYRDRKAARSFKESLQGIREYFQDMSLPIRKFEEEVLKRGGKQDNKSKPYRDMFLSFGRMEKLYTDFMEQKMKPVIEAIPPITKTGISGIEILPYIISKHAVERNPVMRGEELRAWVDSHKDATFQEIEDKRESLKDKDYSGVMEFDTKDGKPLGNYTNPDALARDIVAEFEGKVDKALIDNLWAKIGEATRSTLDTWEISKQISPQQKQDYIDKYRFFVPLRGWRDGAAKELVYTRGQGFGKSLRHAEGRKSLADNPLAYIQQVHFQAIGEQVDGEVKEAMLNLVLNNLGNNEIHDLVTIKKLYYMKVPLADGNYEWEPTTTRPPQEMFANGDATTKIYREHERLRTPSQAKEHEVWTNVSKPGGDLVLVFKGEYLSVGQALNRQNYMIRAIWGKILDAREINRLFGVMGHMNNALKAMYTSWNVVFPFTNFMRDFQEASITQYIKLGPRAGKMVVTGYKGAFPAIMRRLAGKPDMNNKMDRDLEDFYNLGGATGYTHNKTIEEIEKEYDRELRGMVRAGTVRGDIANVFRDVFSAINAWNTLFEDATRFSVYLSSIAAGNTREDAAYDAKEASVNFNRKGKGSKAWDAWFAFFNVAIQSLQKNFKLAKDHPGGFTKVAFAWVMLGFLEAVMNAMTDDDDDPDSAYHNINPYMRHNYLLIPNLPRILAKGEKGNKYLSIPLPQFWRGFKSMGALAFDVGTKKAKPKDAVIMALGDFANSLLPIDLGGFYSDGEFSFAPLAPTIVKPAVELAYNRNFMGYTIKKEPFTREQKQLLANSALGKDNVNVAAKFFTDMLYRWSGGESDYRYHIDSKGRTRRVIMDINPSSLEHLFKGYTGGTGGVFSDLISIVAQALDPDEEIDFRDVPFVNKFIRNTPEAKWNIISEYYDLKKENDRDLALMKEYKKKAMETGDTFLYERMATDEYRVRRQQVFDTYEDQIKELTRKEVKDDLETASLAIEMMDYCIGQVKQLDELYRKNRR